MISNPKNHWLGLCGWLLTWLLLWVCDGMLNLGNLALLLVLGSALSGMWLSLVFSLLASFVSVLGFNWFFVPPRHTFNVDLNQDLLLLVTIWCVSAMVSHLMDRLRLAAVRERSHAESMAQMRTLGEQFRDSHLMSERIELLQKNLQQHVDAEITVMVCQESSEPVGEIDEVFAGPINKSILEGLKSCVQSFQPLGPGTGRFENQPILFLPIRGRSKAHGAVSIQPKHPHNLITNKRLNLQQWCDLLGLEIEREISLKQAQLAKDEAQNQRVRNTLLTSISHDYRTPLANLIGAASVIHTQNTRLSTDHIQQLANTVMLEAQHLNRMTNNTLQLARLDAAPWRIHKDWESLQEIIGSVLTKTRIRYPKRKIHVEVSDDLPWVFCDAMLMVQLIDNLLENSIKYSEDDTAIDIKASANDSGLILHVIDQGCGIPDGWKFKVFDAFERIQADVSQADATTDSQLRRGMGVGLAVCKAIANVHNAQIWIENNFPKGTTLCVLFPPQAQPASDCNTTDSQAP